MTTEEIVKGTLERENIASAMFWTLARKIALRALATFKVNDIDIVDECVMQCYEGLNTYNPNQSLEKWLATVSLNYYRNRFKKEMLVIVENLPNEQLLNETEVDIEEAHENGLNRLKKAITGLSAALKEIYDLKFVKNLKNSEIAAKTGKKLSTITTQIHLIRQQLKS